MKATIKDIAKACGVSSATVSLALSNQPSRIAEETKRRILETARALQYKPNYAAVSLVTKRTKMIGMLIPICAICIRHPSSWRLTKSCSAMGVR